MKLKEVYNSPIIDKIADFFFFALFLVFIGSYMTAPQYYLVGTAVNSDYEYSSFYWSCDDEIGFNAFNFSHNGVVCQAYNLPPKPYISIAFPLLYWFLDNLYYMGFVLVLVHLRRGIDFQKFKKFFNFD